MTRRTLSPRRAGALAALTLLLAGTASAIGPTAVRAAAIAPDAEAWWSLTNTGSAPTVAQPGVAAADMLVEGLEGNKTLPVSVPAPFPSGIGDRGAAVAIAALRFTIPAGATADRLTLQFDGGAPPMVSVLACVTSAAFTPVQGGRWSDVPPYDCSVPSAGALSADGKGVVFPDISALVRGSSLSFVIVPSAADREVLAKPGPGALSLRDPLPAFNLGASQSFPRPPAAGPLPSSRSGSLGFGSVPALAPPAHPVSSAGAPGGSAPGASASGAPAAPAAAPATVLAAPAAAIRDDRPARIAAGLCLAGALAGFLLLALLETPASRRFAFGRRTASPEGAVRPGRGVGRFTRPRTGRPSSL